MVRVALHHGKGPGGPFSLLSRARRAAPFLLPLARRNKAARLGSVLGIAACRLPNQNRRIQVDAIDTLTSKQRAHLRSLAHPLNPVVHIGKDGVSASTIVAAREALNTRELLKIRVLDAAPLSTDETARKLVEALEGAYLVQIIGHVFVVYKPFPDHPDVRLPA